MKKILTALLAIALVWQANAEENTWLTNLPKAEAQAKAENKIVLVDFTGSDWCGWCKKFNGEVLNTPEFQAYAKNNLVLVELDFPHKKEQSTDLKQANANLKSRFAVHGFPTFVALNKDGKEIGRQVGYAKGGPAAFIAKLEAFKKK